MSEILVGADVVLLERSILRLRGLIDRDELRTRLGDLRAGVHAIAERARPSDERRLVFELFVAAWLSAFAADVALSAPDVSCVFEGKHWGVACKSVSGSANSAARRIREGTEQIVTAGVDAGIVAVRITDVFPHSEMRRSVVGRPTAAHCFADGEQAVRRARELLEQVALRVHRALPSGGVPALSKQRNGLVHAVVYIGHTVSYIATEGEPKPVLIPLCRTLPACLPAPAFCVRLFCAVNS